MQKIIKKIFNIKYFIILVTAFTFIGVISSNSNVKAQSYVYDYWKNVIPSAEGVTYKETYYSENIKSVDNPQLSLNKFNKLADMEVYNNKIYLLDQNETGTTNIQLANSTIETTKISYLVVVNQNFQYEKVANQFILSDYAKAKLDEFYHFDTPLDEIDVNQFQSAEYVDIYDVRDEHATASNGIVNFQTFEYDETNENNRGTSLNLYHNDELIDSAEYKYVHGTLFTFMDRERNLENPETFITVEKIVNSLKEAGISNYDVTSEMINVKETINGVQVFKEYEQFNIVVEYVDTAAAQASINKVSSSLSVETTDMTRIYFTDSSKYQNEEIRAIYKYILTPGRAPYLPYYDIESGMLNVDQAAVYLKNAQGITVVNDFIYIADTENARILKLDKNFVVVDVYLTPDDASFYQMYNSNYETEYGTAYETLSVTSEMFSATSNIQEFNPVKVAVMPSGVCYCIATNIYEGLVEFGTDTTFNRFLRKNEVTANAFKQFWSKFLTDIQIGSLALDLPPMFNNVTVSPNGFLYATSNPDSDATTPTKMVKVINTKGNDIMKRNGYVTPDGDAVYLTTTTKSGNVVLGPSSLVDVAVSKTGNFTVVDKNRGRLFTYDSEGNLLYITGAQPGGSSTQGSGTGLSNSIVLPVALNYLYRINENGEEEETIIVLDQYSKSIILYETTEFGNAVNQATYLYQNGVITDTYLVDKNGDYVTVDENGNYAIIKDNKIVTQTENNNKIAYVQETKTYIIMNDEGNEVATISSTDLGDKIIISKGAETYWRQVSKMNTNYELAYLGIGKALNRRGEYKEAMKYFKLAHSSTYYSKAFSSYRDKVLNENFNLIMTVLVVIVVAYILNKVFKKINKENRKMITKGEDK